MGTERQVESLLDELRSEGITDERVLDAMARVPRDRFVPPECRNLAWHNIPLPIGHGQTISQPYVVAIMTQYLELRGQERVLEIGTGSGYQCAVLSELSERVVSVERLEALIAQTREVLAGLGYHNVHLITGDGTLGHEAEAPYDAIMVTAGCPRTPRPLVDQLAEGGRLIVPEGSLWAQDLVLHVKRGDVVTARRVGPVRFVPLIGTHSWHEAEVSALDELTWE